ncbi:unnamed protein product [Protopolystoma xenopodis]|uniref:Uncharacterized protein n=1 Tax=Protopolystoma xenopodis TaxID=117903 RepID=A0A448WQJ0_9PLAT|nr:unnamed protein product [Protopolystoma xenopodis]
MRSVGALDTLFGQATQGLDTNLVAAAALSAVAAGDALYLPVGASPNALLAQTPQPLHHHHQHYHHHHHQQHQHHQQQQQQQQHQHQINTASQQHHLNNIYGGVSYAFFAVENSFFSGTSGTLGSWRLISFDRFLYSTYLDSVCDTLGRRHDCGISNGCSQAS